MTGRLKALGGAVRSPLLSAVLASGLTALLLSGPPEVVTVREVKVVERVPGSDRVIVRTVYVCKGQVGVTAKNHTEDAKARSGDAGTAKRSDGADVNQAGAARSGSIDLGQHVDVDAACSTVNVAATNHVQDVEAETGDAEVKAEAAIPEPSPSPEALTTLVASPSPSPEPSASPSPSPSPSAEVSL